MSNTIGITAGEIWQYLDKHGPTSVSKLTKETQIDVKNIQRGIGWLAQEGKITIETVNRAETIALK
jgi:predicted transcriptional regulator